MCLNAPRHQSHTVPLCTVKRGSGDCNLYERYTGLWETALNTGPWTCGNPSLSHRLRNPITALLIRKRMCLPFLTFPKSLASMIQAYRLVLHHQLTRSTQDGSFIKHCHGNCQAYFPLFYPQEWWVIRFDIIGTQNLIQFSRWLSRSYTNTCTCISLTILWPCCVSYMWHWEDKQQWAVPGNRSGDDVGQLSVFWWTISRLLVQWP